MSGGCVTTADMNGSAAATGNDAVAVVVNVHKSGRPAGSDGASPEKISVSRLPTTGPDLFGRAAKLAQLNKHWKKATRVLTIVAEGGVGKTALVGRWLDDISERNYDGARVFVWSTYKQGSTEQTSADEFIEEALRFCGHDGPLPEPHRRGHLLAEKIRERRTLLVIDGLEPLQFPPGPSEGRLKDQAMQALVKELAGRNPGLCLITTRQAVTDLPKAPRIDLDTLTPQAGAQLLQSLEVNGSAAERAAVAEQYDGHALALTLLGTYLRDACRGDLRRHAEVPLFNDDTAPGRHARRVMAAYEAWLEPRHRAILGLAGLFDRPAPPKLVKVVRDAGVLPDLPAGAQWELTLTQLRRARLLAKEDPLDTHPLVRRYFAERLQQTNAAAWQQAHARLYEHLRDTTPEFPDDRPGLEPLYQAVAHGCQAGLYEQALEVYWSRIRRKDEHFSSGKLGAYGAELAALAGFFAPPWERPVSTLTPDDQAWLLSQAGYTLRAVGRLDEAAAAMAASLDAGELQKRTDAAIVAGNLSETHLLRGAVVAAVATARRAVDLADRSGDAHQKLSVRGALANALAQAGDPTAEDRFRETEALQAERDSAHPRLYSLPGYLYCDLLLDRGAAAEVRDRAAAHLEIRPKGGRTLLDIAFAALALGRAAAQQQDPAAAGLLDDAVAKLHQAATQGHLPRGLLARAAYCRQHGSRDQARRDLDEATDIASRSGMKLFLTDIALEEARLALAGGQREVARQHLADARRLVEETGYHRRDKDLAELAAALG